ncbi:MAG: hypothetical protein QMD92_06595 [bacterium]|nr:hypothetical protein [bacterium]
MNLEIIKRYVDLMDKENLIELEVEDGEFRVSLKKEFEKSDKDKGYIEESMLEEKESKIENDIVEITSPMVGIVHLSKLKIDSNINKGDLLCTVEAMKVENKIKSNHKGVIIDIYIESNTPVEYGQKMFLIKKITE